MTSSNRACSRLLALVFLFSASPAMLSVVLSEEPPRPPFAYHVSPKGDDSNDGSPESPWRTLTHARDFLRHHKGAMVHDITVYLRGGYHVLDNTFHMDDRDSGNNGFYIHFKAVPGERPVVSGGRRVTGWESGANGILSAPFDFQDKVRDLWVNGKRMRMASTGSLHANKIKGLGGWGNYQNTGVPTGIRFQGSSIPLLGNPMDVELITNARWTHHILSVSNISSDALYPGQHIFEMQEPYFHYSQTTLWPEHHPHPKRTFWIVNARELLDEPGEFYFDRNAKRLFYMPHPGEDLNVDLVIAPVVERLLHIEGRSMAQKVRNLTFTGITFQHQAWRLEQVGDSRGASCNQGPKLLRSKGSATELEGDGLLQAAVEVSAAEDIQFHRNVFEHLGGAAINLINGVNRTVVEGNIFRDIGASAVAVAHPDLINTNVLTQFTEEEPCVDNVIRNNYIRATGRTFWAAPAIIGFFPTGIEISQNDIANSAYSAISIGWSWNNWQVTPCSGNAINFNRIFDSCEYLWDGGGVYLLGRQPGTEVVGNYFGGNVDYGAVYADQGTSALAGISGNVCEIPQNKAYFFAHAVSAKNFTVSNTWTTSSIFTNQGTNIPIINTQLFSTLSRPTQVTQIIAGAGLEPAYAGLADPQSLPPLPPWTSPVTFQNWAERRFGSETTSNPSLEQTVWGAGADPDGDGLNNRMEFAMGLDPMKAQPDKRPAVRMENGELIFRYQRDPSATGVGLHPEISGNLLTWTSENLVPQAVATEGGVEILEITIPSGTANAFLRVVARMQ